MDESDTKADSSRTITQLCALVSVAVALAQADECQTGTPFWLLADLFDCLTLQDAERLFALVESLLPTWKSVSFSVLLSVSDTTLDLFNV